MRSLANVLRCVGLTISLALSAVLPLAPNSLAQAQESAAARIARENLPAVVTLVAIDDHDQPLALGSGFFITHDGVAATNAHVVEGAAKVIVRWRSQSGTAVKILAFSPKYDLITIQTSFPTTPAVSLGDSELVTIGQDVIVLGSPQGLEGTVSTGILGGVRALGDIKFLQITAPISPGSSGGPVFNSQGRVIGISTATLAKGQNLNFALPSNLLRNLSQASIRFADVKHAPPGESDAEAIKDLVYFHPVKEETSNYALSYLTASLQNKTNYTIGKVRVLVVIKNDRGDILNYQLTDLNEVVVPPKLAKQVTLSAPAQDYIRWETGSKAWVRGSYEIRILDFKILGRGDSVEELFKKR